MTDDIKMQEVKDFLIVSEGAPVPLELELEAPVLAEPLYARALV